MAFQFGIPLGNISLSEILLAAIPVGLTILISWWVYNIKKRRERVYEWHREMQDIFSSVISVG
jgi:cytochrome c-type biogenesis protein CcmH/NrfF